ncbi:MAG: amino acid ABC transporter permease [Clostridia bacterium]|nr:amino acid ABC transporter permease [Clostridia bacterium]
MYIGDIGFHEHRPDVEVVKEETTNKVVAVQKPKSGFGKVTHDLFLGLGTTLMLFVLTLLFALPLGLVISLGAICKIKIIKMPIKVFVWVIRGTPLMLQLMLFFFGPGLLGFKALNNFTAALIAFVINYACYFSEIFRGGIESIPKGQYEAGKVLGLTKVQVFFKIVLMQVVKNILPPMSNEFLTLVKDTALANTITVIEITWIAKRFISEGLLWPLFYSGVFYLAVCGILTILFNRIEKKLDYYKV